MQAILHAALPADWAAALPTGEYRMSTRGRTLEEEGFIHCSTPGQVVAVANRFYADLDALVLLTVDPERVDAEIRWEPPAPGVEELFPHVYGPLPVTAVTAATWWVRDGDEWAWPDPA